MKATTAFMITLIAFIIYSVALWETAKTTVKNQIIRDTDTLEVQVPISDSTGYKPSVIKIKEKVNIDSIFQVAKEYWQSIIKPDTVYKDYAYVASLDSTYEDDLLKADVSLTSRIPIDPEAYFRLKFDVKKEMIFVPTYKAYEPDKWGVGFGIVGHFTDSVKVNLFGNISYKIINYKHFELPITAEVELNDDFSIRDKIIRAEGRFKF